LFLRAEGGDVGDDDVAVERCGKPGMVRFRHLFGDDHRVEKIRPDAPVFFRNVHAQESLIPHFLPGALWYDARLFPRIHVGNDLLLQKFPKALPEYVVFFSVLDDVHRRFPFLVIHFINSVSYRPKGDIFYRHISIKISHFVRNDNTEPNL
jgi:hypothetical protein